MAGQIQEKKKPKDEEQKKEEERPEKKVTEEELKEAREVADSAQNILDQLTKTSNDLFDDQDLDKLDILIEAQPDELLNRQTEGGQ